MPDLIFKRIIFKAFVISFGVALLTLLFMAEQTAGMLPANTNQSQPFTVSAHSAADGL